MEVWASDEEKRNASWAVVISNLGSAASSQGATRAGYLSKALDLATHIEAREQVPAIPGPDIRKEPRCSDEDRFRYQDHLANMFATGRLSRDEWELRDGICRNAVTLSEMTKLLKDLPGLPAEKQIIPVQAASPKRAAAEKAKNKTFAAVLGGVTFSLAATFSNALSVSDTYHNGLNTLSLIFGLGAILSLLATMAIVVNAAMAREPRKRKGK